MRVPSSPPSRYFTPHEANALVAEVSKHLGHASELGKRLRQIVTTLSEGKPSEHEREQLTRDAERLRAEITERIEAIQKLGAEVKGVDSGLVDFPALRNGEQVYLCWRLGETKIEWWHPLETGFAGRQRIAADTRARWEWCN